MFGWGRLPASKRHTLESEGLRFLEEGLPAILTLRQYRAPGRMTSFRRQGGSAALALSSERLVLAIYRRSIVDLRFDDACFAHLEIDKTDRGLRISFEAERFDDRQSGAVEVRLRTDCAQDLLDRIAASRQTT